VTPSAQHSGALVIESVQIGRIHFGAVHDIVFVTVVEEGCQLPLAFECHR
jgi:hypothetical protein